MYCLPDQISEIVRLACVPVNGSGVPDTVATREGRFADVPPALKDNAQPGPTRPGHLVPGETVPVPLSVNLTIFTYVIRRRRQRAPGPLVACGGARMR